MKLTAFFACIGVSLASLAATSALAADKYPSKSIRFIVPYGTGGGSDILARQIGAKLQEAWGQAVVIENRTGASGNIGTEMVVRSPADGHTLLLQNSSMVVSPASMAKMSNDPEKDLTPIILLGLTPMALVAHPGTGIKNLAGMVEQAKSKPNSLSYASCGLGTPQYFVMEQVKQKTGVDAAHVAYKGCAPGLTDVLGGQIPLALLSANIVAPYVKSGRLVGLGVSTNTRYGVMPEVPTFEEQGIKPLDLSIWYALMGPAKMPPDLVNRIHAEVRKILADPQIAAKLSAVGIEPYNGNAADLAKLIKTDLVLYAKLAKALDIKPE
ncbi:MAG: tripartite tricarboxylate transporter substrate binding protein [Noviherbaspirillum sp.]|nr:tripartite tricarboxylate transporter substrate binding protein [Noviherbaspirillum sp.]